MIWQYILAEMIFLWAAGFSFFGGKGLIGAFVCATAVNFWRNGAFFFLGWEVILVIYLFLGLGINYFFNRKTDGLRVVKVAAGSGSALLVAGMILPVIPAFMCWALVIGLPLLFTRRKLPKAVWLQIIFQFIFSAGWLIIGNILY